MRSSGPARTLALGFALASLVCGEAQAQRAEVEAWSVGWVPGFSDLFDDGVFSSGPGQLYNIGCPANGAGVTEANGVLTIPGASFPCKGFEVQPNARIPGGATMRALFDVALPPIGASYGMAIKNVTESDAVYLLIRRGPGPGGAGGSDALFIELSTESGTPVAAIVLADNPDSNPQVPQLIELELTLTPNAVTGTLIPSARYSECGSGVQPCDPRPALQPLPPVALPPADGGALAAGVLHIPAFKEFVPPDPSKNPFAVSIEDWSLTMAADDDFETPPLGAKLPYQTSASNCGSASVGNGALALDLLGSCPKVVAAFVGSLASELDASATYRFAIPDRCDSYGLGASAQSDFADLSVVRDEDGSLAVWLTTEPETGGPQLPILERTTLSSTPLSDALLAATAAVELRLLLAGDGLGGLVPHGQFRLCDTSPCAPGVVFEDLAPAEFTLPPPNGTWCGSPLAERALPTDGGRIAGGIPVTANLFATAPEPAASASAAAAIAALLYRRRRHR